jgi:hypothetical protein
VWVDRRAAISSAANGNVYFGDGIGSMNDVLATRLDANGNVIDTTPIVISQADFNQTEPQVAWNGSAWLVTWMTERDQYYSDVNAVRVGADGHVLDASPIVLDQATTSINQFPPYTVSSDGTNWSVMWKDLDSTGSRWILVGSNVTPDGTVTNPGGRTLRQTAGNNFIGFADLAFAGDEYLGTWLEYGADAVSPVIKAQRFTTALAPVGSPVTVDSYSPSRAYRPNVATDGTNFLVTWSEDRYAYRQVFAARVSHAGAVLDPNWHRGHPLRRRDDIPRQRCDVRRDQLRRRVQRSACRRRTSSRISTRSGSHRRARWLARRSSLMTRIGSQQRPAVAPAANGGTQVVWLDFAGSGGDSNINGAQIAADGTVARSSPSAPAPRANSLRPWRTTAAGTLPCSGRKSPAKSASSASAFPPRAIRSTRSPSRLRAAAIRSATPTSRGTAASTWSPGATPTRCRPSASPADGSVIDASPIAVMPGIQPAVEAVGSTFLVADVNSPTDPHFRYTYVARVSAAGAVIDAPQRIGNSFDSAPHIAAVGGRWLVVWNQAVTHDNPDSSSVADFINPDGTADPKIAVTATRAGQFPNVASDGNSALIVFNTPTTAATSSRGA